MQIVEKGKCTSLMFLSLWIWHYNHGTSLWILYDSFLQNFLRGSMFCYFKVSFSLINSSRSRSCVVLVVLGHCCTGKWNFAPFLLEWEHVKPWGVTSSFPLTFSLYFDLFILSSILTSFTVSVAEIHPHCALLQEYSWPSACFPPDETPWIQARSFFVSSDHRIYTVCIFLQWG